MGSTVPDLHGNKVVHAAAGDSHLVLVLEDGTARAFGDNSSDQTHVPDLHGNAVIQAAAQDHTVLVLTPKDYILTLTLTLDAIVVLNVAGETMGSYEYSEEGTVEKVRVDMSAKTGLTAKLVSQEGVMLDNCFDAVILHANINWIDFQSSQAGKELGGASGTK